MKTRIAVAVLSAVAGAAQADVIHVQFTGTQQGQNVAITSPSYNGAVFAGQLKHTLSGGPSEYNGNWITYCTDLAQHVTSNTANYDIVPLTMLPDNSPMGAAKASAIRDMYVWANGSQLTNTTSDDLATAFQLAVWEIVTDFNSAASGYGLSVTGGAFRATKTNGTALSSGVMTQLNSLFGSIGAGTPSPVAVMGVRSGQYQDQIVAVPAPGAAALAGLGVVCLTSRRRAR